MSTPVRIVGRNGNEAEIDKAGNLVVALGPFDEPVFKELAEVNTAYNFYTPRVGFQFILTGMIAYGDKQVSGSTNATVVIYEASAPDATTEDKIIIQFELGQNQSLPFPSIRVKTTEGRWINAKTDDDDIHLTLLGHFIPRID